MREFQNLLGIDIENLKLEEVDKIPNFSSDRNLEADLMVATASNERLKVYDIKVEKAKIDIDLARGNYFPIVGIGFAKDFVEEKHHRNSYRVGVWFKWNLFRWGADVDNVSVAQIQNGTNKERK